MFEDTVTETKFNIMDMCDTMYGNELFSLYFPKNLMQKLKHVLSIHVCMYTLIHVHIIVCAFIKIEEMQTL